MVSFHQLGKRKEIHFETYLGYMGCVYSLRMCDVCRFFYVFIYFLDLLAYLVWLILTSVIQNQAMITVTDGIG